MNVEKNQYPVSAYQLTAGLVYFARMASKIRLQAVGQLPSAYLENLGTGFDGRCCRFLGVEYSAVRELIIEGLSDKDALAWCFEHGTRPSEEQILVWNSFMRKRGWRDEDGGSATLKRNKEASGLADRDDIQTTFDYFEVDEHRRP